MWHQNWVHIGLMSALLSCGCVKSIDTANPPWRGKGQIPIMVDIKAIGQENAGFIAFEGEIISKRDGLNIEASVVSASPNDCTGETQWSGILNKDVVLKLNFSCAVRDRASLHVDLQAVSRHSSGGQYASTMAYNPPEINFKGLNTRQAQAMKYRHGQPVVEYEVK